MYQKERFGAFSAGTGIMTITQEPYHDDLSDGAGHGTLIATDQIFFQIASSNTGAQNTAAVKVWYRWKNVSLQEYVGIVQSQQQ